MSVIKVKCIRRSTNIVFRPSAGRGKWHGEFQLVWTQNSRCFSANSLISDLLPHAAGQQFVHRREKIRNNRGRCFFFSISTFALDLSKQAFCAFLCKHNTECAINTGPWLLSVSFRWVILINKHPYSRSANKP